MSDRKPDAPREVVLASAGSGKTYRLAWRICGLLGYGASPEAIFASTFTRKAAGEILSRVLERLAEAALDDKKAARLAEDGSIPGAQPLPADSAFWQGILENTARVVHRMNVGTLDAFFVSTARAFAPELGLSPGWTIADEAAIKRQFSEALGNTIERLRRDVPEAFQELLVALGRGDVRRSVHDTLLSKTDALLQIQAELDPAVQDPWAVFGTSTEREPTEAESARLLERLPICEVPRTAQGTPNSNWVKEVDRICTDLREHNWEALVGRGLVKGCEDERAQYYKADVPPDLLQAVRAVRDLARRALRPKYAKEIAALGLLARVLDCEHRSIQTRDGQYSFSDVTRRFTSGENLTSRDDLYYRLDGRIEHVLLDEFQDTSLTQWEALEPLLTEVLQDSARAGIIVADPKQSIYGWRGGEPAVVHHVQDYYGLPPARLSKSFRSSQVVLDFVNEVFQTPADAPTLQEDARLVEAAETWAFDYEEHEAARKLPGYVRVAFGPARQGKSNSNPALLRRAAELVRDLHLQAPEATIGVLTRQNKSVGRILYELQRMGVPASGEGGTSLTDSAACEAALALLIMADHPGDMIARAHVALSPMGETLDFTDPNDGRGAERLAMRIRKGVMEIGYSRTLDALVGRLAGACNARELRRLTQLVERAAAYDERPTLRPSDFVRLIELQRVEDAAAAPVRVMTIHQSKGLQFGTVVLPDLDGPLVKVDKLPALPYRHHPVAPISSVYPNPPGEVRCLFPEIEKAHAQARQGSLRDNLSALYVGLTRAEHALHVILSADSGKLGTSKSTARYLRERLAGGAEPQPAQDGDILYEGGNPDWPAVLQAAEKQKQHDGGPHDEAKQRSPRHIEHIGLKRTSARTRLLPRRSPSQMEGGDQIRIGDLLDLTRGPAMERGRIVHAWFELVGWIDDGLPGREQLVATGRRLAPDVSPAFLEDLAESFIGWMNHADIQSAFTRSAYPPGAEVRHEVPFVGREIGTFVEGFIDRLVLIQKEGEVVGAEVIDIKTDMLGDDRARLAERVEHYAPQIRAYARAVSRLYRLAPDAITTKLVFVDGPLVAEVSDTATSSP